MAEGLQDLMRGSNIIDTLVSKQLELKEKEMELNSRATALTIDQASLAEEQAAVAAKKEKMIAAQEAARVQAEQMLDEARAEAAKVKARATVEAMLYAEASAEDAKHEAKQTTDESNSAANAMREVLRAERQTMKAEEQKLRETRTAFEAEMAEARKHDERLSGRVELDVGGVRFSTSVETLVVGNSPYFLALFSGAWKRDEAKPIFIDRDPAAFAVILRYLRYACKPEFLTSALAGMTEEDRWALMAEAEYFQLEEAVSVINATAAGENKDLQSLAQIVGKRLKVRQTRAYESNCLRNEFAVDAVP